MYDFIKCSNNVVALKRIVVDGSSNDITYCAREGKIGMT